MLTVEEFHIRLFGSTVPRRCRVLYEAFEREGSRGFDSEEHSLLDFQAALVVALYQARSSFNSDGTVKDREYVTIFVPEAWQSLAIEDLRTLVKCLVKIRKGNARAVSLITEAVKLLRIVTKPKFVPSAPERWVVLGFTKDSPAPAWLRNRLLADPKKAV